MQYITEKPIDLEDGSSQIVFKRVSTPTEITYNYHSEQNAVLFENQGDSVIVLTINGTQINVIPGEKRNIAESISKFTVQSIKLASFTVTSWGMDAASMVTEMKKPLIPSKIKLLSESILGQGSFVSQLELRLGCSTTQSIYGGSHIGAALAEMADEVYSPCVSENSIKYSNDMTQSTWVTTGKTTILEELNDGLVWNKVVKLDSTSSIGPRVDAISPYPVGANGCVVIFDMYIPIGTTPAPMQSVNVWLSNRTTLVGDIFATVSNLVAGKKYRVVAIFDESAIVWEKGAGDTIRFMLQMNTSNGHAACTSYFRNVAVSWMNDSTYEKYVPSLGSFVAPGTSEWKEIPKNPYEDDYEAVIISYGRNEAGDSVNSKSHFRAYDKLIQNCLNKCGYVLPTNPPASYNANSDKQWANDLYISNGFNTVWELLMKKWNAGVDVNTLFRAQSNPTLIMTDSVHQNSNGAALMVDYFAKEIATRKINPGSKAELTGNIRYYLSGIPTGTWKRVLVPTGVEQRLVNSVYAYCMESSTINDALSFPSTRFQQLHIIYRQDPTYGRVDIVIDEGTASEQTTTLNTAYASVANRLHGHFVCDFGNSDNHTVKIKVKDSLVVRIHGIVVI